LAVAAPRYEFIGGTLSLSSPEPCTKETLFDLASLTKVFATTLICAEAIRLGILSLDEKPFAQWPTVRIVDLLQHTSGLPAICDFYRRHSARSDVFKSALALDLAYTTGSKTLYSDVGFIALGALLEKRFKAPLDIVFTALSQRYYGSTSMRFLPKDSRRAAPTGICPIRRRHLRGEVNDLNAFSLHGIAPHAGLFGTLSDVEHACNYFLSSLKNSQTPLSPILNTFVNAKGTRAIGFDRADPKGSTGGALSSLTVGHLGFTGTSFWIDPIAAKGRGAYFVLLTNHLEASSRKTELLQLRRDFHRVGMRWLAERMI
jgi:CubicO group peptidase (beta-lactamase class C family)